MNQNLINAVACVANRMIERGYKPQVINNVGKLIARTTLPSQYHMLANSDGANRFISRMEEQGHLTRP